jgi:hypothetical protein
MLRIAIEREHVKRGTNSLFVLKDTRKGRSRGRKDREAR